MCLRKRLWLVILFMGLSLLWTGCSLLLPTPSNEEIRVAIEKYMEKNPDTESWMYEEIQVPTRWPGKAQALLWTEDYSVQKNFLLLYEDGAFVVDTVETLVRSEDGTYRSAP